MSPMAKGKGPPARRDQGDLRVARPGREQPRQPRALRGPTPRARRDPGSASEDLEPEGYCVVPLTTLFSARSCGTNWPPTRPTTRARSRRSSPREPRRTSRESLPRSRKKQKFFMGRRFKKTPLTMDSPWLELGSLHTHARHRQQLPRMWSKLSYADQWYTPPSARTQQAWLDSLAPRLQRPASRQGLRLPLDVDEGTGPFEYVPGSARGALRRRLAVGARGESYPPGEEFQQRVPDPSSNVHRAGRVDDLLQHERVSPRRLRHREPAQHLRLQLRLARGAGGARGPQLRGRRLGAGPRVRPTLCAVLGEGSVLHGPCGPRTQLRVHAAPAGGARARRGDRLRPDREEEARGRLRPARLAPPSIRTSTERRRAPATKDDWSEVGIRLRSVSTTCATWRPSSGRAQAAPPSQTRVPPRRRAQGPLGPPAPRPALPRGLLERAARSLPLSDDVGPSSPAQAPDVVLVTPLLEPGSRPGRLPALRRGALGIPSGLFVASWDNLTMKGTIQSCPTGHGLERGAARRGRRAARRPERARRGHRRGGYDHWFGWEPSRTREEFAAASAWIPRGRWCSTSARRASSRPTRPVT